MKRSLADRGRMVALLWRHELRQLARDRQVVVFSVLLPLAVVPLLLWINTYAMREREQKQAATVFQYAVVGVEAELARAAIDSAMRTLAPSDGGPPFQLTEVQSADPMAALARRELHFYVEALSAGALRAEREARAQSRPPVAGEPVARTPRSTVPLLRIWYEGDRDLSSAGAARLRALLMAGRATQRLEQLRERGFTVASADFCKRELHDLAPPAARTGARFGGLLMMLFVLLVMGSGSVAAADSIAGEKERGTLETLLTTAADRGDIVLAKQLAILTTAFVIAAIQIGNLLLYVGFGLMPLPADFVVDLSPPAVLALAGLLLPVAALSASALLWISGLARSYKEAQLYFSAAVLIGLLPTLTPMLQGVELRSAIALVPIAGASVAVRDVLSGRVDVLFLLISCCVNLGAAIWVGRATARFLATERFLARPARDAVERAGGAPLFERRVLPWFIGMWIVIFIAATNVTALQKMVPSVLFNLLVVFGGGTALLLAIYCLDVRQALALRLPRWPVWIAVAIGVPSAQLIGNGLFVLVSQLLPAPERLLQTFERELLPPDLPVWQLVVLIALLPGLFEEIAFRGLLLHGLHRRLRPIALCLVVGLVFGLFHISLFRIVPTAFLGVVFSAVVLLTGSIFPAMVWHAANNGLAVATASAGLQLAEVDATLYALAVAAFALSMWILYRCRTPYPGLRRLRS